jgi:hypothetical protein
MRTWFHRRFKLMWLAVWLRTSGKDREGWCVPLRGLRGLRQRVTRGAQDGSIPSLTARRLNVRISDLIVDLFDECRRSTDPKPVDGG